MAPGPFSILIPFLSSRKSKKYEKLQTDDPEKRRIEATQEEINRLNLKIDKLVTSMSREDLDPATGPDDGCVVCCHSRAVMQVAPCGHQAQCRLCFVHNIQDAVANRNLPLRCLICGSKIIRVKNNTKGGNGLDHPVHVGLGARLNGVRKIPKSVSGYSLCATNDFDEQPRHPSIAQSASSYSMTSGLSSMSSSSYESTRSVKSAGSVRSNASQRSAVSNSSWFSIGSLTNFQAPTFIDTKSINRQPRAHSLSSCGKQRLRPFQHASAASETSNKKWSNNINNNNNNNNFISESASAVVASSSVQNGETNGLYKEPRLNKSDSTGLAQNVGYIPLSPNSIDDRIRAIQQGLTNKRLNNTTTNDKLPPTRRIISGRESFRQRSSSSQAVGGSTKEQQNLNIDNCFLLKSQLRRLSGTGKDVQIGRARYTKSPELIETTFSMSTIEEENEIALSLKNLNS